MRTLAIFILVAGTATIAFAPPVDVPEVNADSVTTALALLSGGLLVFRGRRKS